MSRVTLADLITWRAGSVLPLRVRCRVPCNFPRIFWVLLLSINKVDSVWGRVAVPSVRERAARVHFFYSPLPPPSLSFFRCSKLCSISLWSSCSVPFCTVECIDCTVACRLLRKLSLSPLGMPVVQSARSQRARNSVVKARIKRQVERERNAAVCHAKTAVAGIGAFRCWLASGCFFSANVPPLM